MLMRSPLARERKRPAGFIVPCVPTLSDRAPSGPQWIHEIKHDGYRVIASKTGDRVRLWSRTGRDWSRQFSAIARAVLAVDADEFVIDGEACAHCPDGLPDFHGVRSDGGASACLFAFDLLRADGQDLRPLPLEERRARLRTTLWRAPPSLRIVEHLEGDGPEILRHACARWG
jgi:bifunctional non-homologous end joining protein LigD